VKCSLFRIIQQDYTIPWISTFGKLHGFATSLVLTAPNGPFVTLVLGGGSELHISTPSPSILMFMVVSVPVLANEQRWFINLKPCLQIFQALLGLMISRIRWAAIAVLWTPY